METTKHLLVYLLDRSRDMTARAGTRDDFDETFFFLWTDVALRHCYLIKDLLFVLFLFSFSFPLSLSHFRIGNLPYEIKTNI